MPYRLVGNCVYKGEEKLKCYDNHEDAVAYLRALNANVKDSLHEFSMYISKSSLSNGVMRWMAVSSDTDWDLYGERMSLELYKSMIAKIKSKASPPEPFAEFVTSDFWKGGMPYLSIAHYADGNGKAVPGEVRELFIDGTQLKAKGTLHNTPLGLAVWKSLKQDEINYKNSLDTDRIRISIAFLDLAHKHGEHGQIFRRNSPSDGCPECKRGIGEKIYLDGYLVHLALTRVPVNPRTIMLSEEETMAKKSKPETRLEDAVSVLGDEKLAEEVAQVNLEAKSQINDAIVEMSDTEEVTPEVTEEKSASEEKIEVIKSELEALVQTLISAAMSKKTEEYDEEEEEKKKKDKPVDEKSEAVEAPVQKSALELSMEKLYNSVTSVVAKAAPAEEKLQELQPLLNEVGQIIISMVRGESPEQKSEAPINDAVLEQVRELSAQLSMAKEEIANLKSSIMDTQGKLETARVPAPRSVSPTITKSEVPAGGKPNSVMNIARRSVGL